MFAPPGAFVKASRRPPPGCDTESRTVWFLQAIEALRGATGDTSLDSGAGYTVKRVCACACACLYVYGYVCP